MHDVVPAEKILVPAACPVCRSTEVTSASKTIDETTYWRCRKCGEVWNIGRRREPSPWGGRRW